RTQARTNSGRIVGQHRRKRHAVQRHVFEAVQGRGRRMEGLLKLRARRLAASGKTRRPRPHLDFQPKRRAASGASRSRGRGGGGYPASGRGGYLGEKEAVKAVPNWCDCDLRIEGPKAKVDEFLLFAKGEEGCFDFERFVPYPAHFAEL